MPRLRCFYDGRCGLCQRSRRWLERLDWLQRVEWVDQTEVPDDELPVSRDAALDALPAVTPSGRVLMGHDAVRRALLVTPLGFLPALLMYLPGIAHLGRAVYRRIAAARKRDPAVGACRLHTEPDS
ncbi:MAG: thiol-disulfide oxidoreductase DCC family protein [Phycisphaerales bacterium JB037]